jgi:hypothetical protein
MQVRPCRIRAHREYQSCFNGSYSGDLSTLDMVVTERTAAGRKVMFPIAIHACAITPLNGFSSSGYCIQKHSFEINDKLSFERAFYTNDFADGVSSARPLHCDPAPWKWDRTPFIAPRADHTHT